MNEITTHTQKEMSRWILFPNGIVLVDEYRDGVNMKVERWREAVEFKDFKKVVKRLNTWIAISVGMYKDPNLL